MKLTSARLLTALLLVAVLILAARLVWIAAKTETGWETLGLSWYNSMLGPIGRERQPIGDRDPAEQAEIWLREVDRVLAAHPDDARIAMGAAWMLDSPGFGFQHKHIKLELWPWPGPGPWLYPEWDHEAVERASDRFEVKCATRCLKLAADSNYILNSKFPRAPLTNGCLCLVSVGLEPPCNLRTLFRRSEDRLYRALCACLRCPMGLALSLSGRKLGRPKPTFTHYHPPRVCLLRWLRIFWTKFIFFA